MRRNRTSPRKVTPATVKAFYGRFCPKPRLGFQPLDPGRTTLTNGPQGLGDTAVVVSWFETGRDAMKTAHAWMPSPTFDVLARFAGASSKAATRPPCMVNLADAVARWDLGAGHMVQRAARVFGVRSNPVPDPWIEASGVRRIPGRVSLHFEAGAHAEWQRAHLHPRARQVYPETWAVLREFIAAATGHSWIEVGGRRCLPMDEVEDGTGRPLEETIRLLAECEFHLGIISGPMHLAAALGSKVIAIINFPSPKGLMLPNLVSIGVVEEEWLYPHQVVLHQEIDSPHWPKVSRRSIDDAFAGRVWPYWDRSVVEECHA